MTKKVPVKLFPEVIDIQGNLWEITIRDYDSDPFFKKCNADGYCYHEEKRIVVCDIFNSHLHVNDSDVYKCELMKSILRHEIVHAYLYESGLSESSIVYNEAWPVNEEMVDWFAQQGEKIFKTWTKCHCLRLTDPERWMKWKKQEELDNENH